MPNRVLVVEDEIIVAKDIELKLTRMGHVVIGIAMNGPDAVKLALTEQPDLILMDIKLHGKMDGIEAARQIHAQAQIPLLFLTALNDDETLQRAKITEPFAYIQKPITSRELHIAVEIALYKHTVQKELSVQLQRMTAMRMIDQAIIKGEDLQTTMRVVLNQVVVQLDLDAAAVMLVSPFSNLLDYFQVYGFRTSQHVNLHVRIGQGLAGNVVSSGRRMTIKNLRETSETDDRFPWMFAEGFVSYVAIPLMNKDGVLGVLEGFKRSEMNFTRDWYEFLDTLAQQTSLAVENTTLNSELSAAAVEIMQSNNATVAGLAAALELRDNDTRGHSQRVTELTLRVARRMGIENSEILDQVRRGALLHDIGKVGIPDIILLKQGTLSEEEWQVMRRHPELAKEMLSTVPFLRNSLEIPLYHHERWDGSGYPFGLKGSKIPLPARIFAVVDVWDALLSDRPYREAWSKEKTLAYLRENSGVLFDPDVVREFLDIVS